MKYFTIKATSGLSWPANTYWNTCLFVWYSNCIFLNVCSQQKIEMHHNIFTECKKLKYRFLLLFIQVFNRPSVAVAVLQTPFLLINWLSESAFSSKFPANLHSQAVRARELKFWDNIHLPQHIICHMSCVTCQMSFVTCHMSCVTCIVSHVLFFNKVVKLVGGGSVINGAYPV